MKILGAQASLPAGSRNPPAVMGGAPRISRRRKSMRTTIKVPPLALSLTICLTLIAATFGTTFGQAVYGSVFGTVTDSSGAAVPNATVTITNTGTNVSETTKTNGSGNYTQTRLIPGTYRLKVEAP